MVPIENVYEQIRTFAADAGARKVVLFGSRAKGVNRPKSDIDLAVAGCPDFNRLEQNLQDNLWSLLKVDVINLDEPISSSLRAEIERSGKVLYEKIWPFAVWCGWVCQVVTVLRSSLPQVR